MSVVLIGIHMLLVLYVFLRENYVGGNNLCDAYRIVNYSKNIDKKELHFDFFVLVF